MKQTLLRTQIALLCLVAGCVAPSPAAGASPKWTLGAPIVTYWAGPADMMPLDDRAAAQIAAGGWNLGWARNVTDLDIYRRHGLRALLVIGVPDLDSPAAAKALDATIEQVRHHPALYAYHLVDEPGASAFPKLGRLTAYLRQRDPGHLAYINLFPTYATNEQLGTRGDTVPAYRDYLRQFVEVVKPGLISYDHYHFMKSSDGDQYFLNLALIREASLAAGLPFLNIIQACDSPSEGWRGPGQHEIRWLMYTSLAYGAQGISHFRYDTGLCKDADTPNALYWPVTRLNRDFFSIARELHALKSLGAYHCGKVPYGALPLPKDSRFAPEVLPQEILLGYFGKSARRPSHLVVVNLDYKNAVTTTLAGPGPMQLFHAPTQVWRGDSKERRLKLELPPGGGALVRLRP